MNGTLLSGQLGTAQLGLAQLGQYLRLGASQQASSAISAGAFWWWQPGELAHRLIEETIGRPADAN